jgi:hypothetical protein
MTVDRRGSRAAEVLWRTSADVDVEDRLAELHRTHLRSRRRRSVAGAAALVGLGAVGAVTLRPALVHEPTAPTAPTSPSPTSGLGYDVVATDLSPSGQFRAWAALRDGQPAVVLVRRVGSETTRVVWSAETPQELVRANPSRPVAVTWSRDSRRVVVLVARAPYGRSSETDDLRLLTVGRDGSGRREVPARLGECACTQQVPRLAWSADGRRLEVEVPRRQGSDRISVTLP